MLIYVVWFCCYEKLCIFISGLYVNFIVFFLIMKVDEDNIYILMIIVLNFIFK